MNPYEQATIFLRAVFSGIVTHLALLGPNGVGKTILVKKIAEESRRLENKPGGVVFKSGHTSIPALKDQLASYNEKTPDGQVTIFVLNDCSAFHSTSPRDVAFWKSLLESQETGFAEYSTTHGTERINIKKLRFIFTANESVKTRNPHLRAIFDRIHTVVFNLTILEKLSLTNQLLIQNQSDRVCKSEILLDIIERIARKGFDNYSLRLFNKLYTAKTLSTELYKAMLSNEFPLNDNLLAFHRIQHLNDDPRVKEITKIIQFEKDTGLRRRSYFYYKKKYPEWLVVKNKYEEFVRPNGQEEDNNAENNNRMDEQDMEFNPRLYQNIARLPELLR